MVSTRRSMSRGIDTPPPPPPLSKADTEPTLVKVTDPASAEMVTNLSRSKENVIDTPSGQVKVRPYRSSSNAQLKAVLSFTPRVSSLDRENAKSAGDEFRGFFVLFWICLGLLFIRTSLHSWQENRTPLSWKFGRLITGDVLVLAASDLLMVLGQFFCVPFVKGLIARRYRYHWVGVGIQHTYQTLYLSAAIWWGWHRQWYWVQAGFLVLHCLSNLMKMHSYMAHNGMLATVYFRLQKEKKQLDDVLANSAEGHQAIVEEATARRTQYAEGGTPVGTPGIGSTPLGTPALSTSGRSSPPNVTFATLDGTTSYTTRNGEGAVSSASAPEAYGYRRGSDPDTGRKSPDPGAGGDGLRRRSIVKNAASGGKKRGSGMPQPDPDLPHGTSLEPSHNTMPHAPREPNVLSYSSDEKIAVLARNIDMMEDELQSNGAKGLVWPQNVTYRNYFDYVFFPTLVYQLEYPRTDTMRPLVVLEKIAATFGTFSLIYTITEHYILPYTPKAGESLLISFFNLALPMMVNYLLIFYIIFECVCTGFAELSYFADREFYQDWWNSTSWDQFSRKWNKPVHTFLLRHVYASTMDGLQLSRTSATFITFLLSALCHELVMAVVSKKIRPYLFLMQMVQLPMIAVGRMPFMKRNKTIGNLTFWIGLMMGFPFLAVCYLRF